MASITLSVSENLKAALYQFSWVNWSGVAREESRKKKIYEKYMKTGKLLDKDKKFCDEIDWHPVDELPLREEYLQKLKRTEKGPHHCMDLNKLDKLMGLK